MSHDEIIETAMTIICTHYAMPWEGTHVMAQLLLILFLTEDKAKAEEWMELLAKARVAWRGVTG